MAQFATADDLGIRLGVTLTDDEQTRANAMLTDASGIVQDETGQTIELVDDDTLERRGTTDERILLPQRPVVSVASVALDGAPITDWYLAGNEIVRNGGSLVEVVLNDTYFGPYRRGFGFEGQTLAIVYTHGYAADAIPGRIKSITLNMVTRAWVNPGAVIRENEGNVGVEYAPRTEQPRGLELLESERVALRRLLGSRGASPWVGT